MIILRSMCLCLLIRNFSIFWLRKNLATIKFKKKKFLCLIEWKNLELRNQISNHSSNWIESEENLNSLGIIWSRNTGDINRLILIVTASLQLIYFFVWYWLIKFDYFHQTTFSPLPHQSISLSISLSHTLTHTLVLFCCFGVGLKNLPIENKKKIWIVKSLKQNEMNH